MHLYITARITDIQIVINSDIYLSSIAIEGTVMIYVRGSVPCADTYSVINRQTPLDFGIAGISFHGK